MQDSTDHGNGPFTVQEAQALRARFIDLLLRCDELSAELESHRLVLAELEDIRRFLTDGTKPFIATAATNGHLATARAQANIRESNADTSHTGETTRGNSREQDAAESHTGENPDADRGETDAGDAHVPVYKPPFLNVSNHNDDAAVTATSHTGVTPERPQQGTLLLKIVELFEASDRPLSRWDVQKRLGLTRMPSAELSKLVSQSRLVRVREGVYAAAVHGTADV